MKKVTLNICRVSFVFIAIIFLTSCGKDVYRGGYLIPLISKNSFIDLDKNIKLPAELVEEDIILFDEKKIEPLKGEWNKKIFKWYFTTEKYPKMRNGLIDIRFLFLPPKQFRFNLSFRSYGNSSCTLEVLSNRMKISRKKKTQKNTIVEYPLNFVPKNNRLRIIFFHDLLIVSFNGEEIGRIKNDALKGYGTIDSININASNNLGLYTRLGYLSLDHLEEKESLFYNFHLQSDLPDDLKKYVRTVRMGDLTMPSVLSPVTSKIEIPLEIPTRESELRFSVATIPVTRKDLYKIRYLVHFIDDAED